MMPLFRPMIAAWVRSLASSFNRMLLTRPFTVSSDFAADGMVVDCENPNRRAGAVHDVSPPTRAAVLEANSRDHQVSQKGRGSTVKLLPCWR
jgi:hypothetical protein